MSDDQVREHVGHELARQAQDEIKKGRQVFLHLRSGTAHEVSALGLVSGAPLAECGLASGFKMLVSLDAIEAVRFGEPASYSVGAMIA